MAYLSKSSKRLYGAPLGTMWREFGMTFIYRISMWIITARSVIFHEVQKNEVIGCMGNRGDGLVAFISFFTKHGKEEVVKNHFVSTT